MSRDISAAYNATSHLLQGDYLEPDPLPPVAGQPSAALPQPGWNLSAHSPAAPQARYQLVAVAERFVYLLDVTTGRAWWAEVGGNGSWNELAAFPQNTTQQQPEEETAPSADATPTEPRQ